MHLLLVLVSCLTASIALAQTASVATAEAAVRLKKAHVERTLEECRLRGGSDDRCRKVLQMIHERELKVLARLAPALADPSVNLGQFNTELTACYNPNNDYSDLIECWALLADRLDAARKGQFLLKR